MKNSKLNPETIKMINDLKDDIEKMFFMESNIEVIWKMEKLQNDKSFQKSADFIRKSLEEKTTNNK
jgi:hypothetical protein